VRRDPERSSKPTISCLTRRVIPGWIIYYKRSNELELSRLSQALSTLNQLEAAVIFQLWYFLRVFPWAPCLCENLHFVLLDAVLGEPWPCPLNLILAINQLLVERFDLVIERPHPLVYRVRRIGEGRQWWWRFLLAREMHWGGAASLRYNALFGGVCVPCVVVLPLGCAASGGVLAPQPPCATRSQPEFMRTLVSLVCLVLFPFCFVFFYLHARYLPTDRVSQKPHFFFFSKSDETSDFEIKWNK